MKKNVPAMSILVVLAGGTAAVIGTAAVMGGCATLSPTASGRIETHREDPQTTELRQKIDGLYNLVDNKTTQIKNDLWPVVAIVVLGIAVPGIVVLCVIAWFIKSWIRDHSYLKQKPQWEGCKHTPSMGGTQP